MAMKRFVGLCQQLMAAVVKAAGIEDAEPYLFAASAKKAGKPGASILTGNLPGKGHGVIVKASGGGTPADVRDSVVKAAALCVRYVANGNVVKTGPVKDTEQAAGVKLFETALSEMKVTREEFDRQAEILIREATDRPATTRKVTLIWTVAGQKVAWTVRIPASERIEGFQSAMHIADPKSFTVEDPTGPIVKDLKKSESAPETPLKAVS